MNKSITITAIPSDNPYICVASDIPGYDGGEQTASIFVNTPLPEITTQDPLAVITTPMDHHKNSIVIREYYV